MEAYLAKCTVMQAIFNALCDNPRGLTAHELISWVYKGNKEPTWAISSIQVCCVKFNQRMAEVGSCIRIKGTPGPGGRRQIWIVR